MRIEFISRNEAGNYWIGYRINVTRGIRGKTKGKVDELIIVGMRKDKFKKFVNDHLKDFEEYEERMRNET